MQNGHRMRHHLTGFRDRWLYASAAPTGLDSRKIGKMWKINKSVDSVIFWIVWLLKKSLTPKNNRICG
jgi:hypothetical protein